MKQQDIIHKQLLAEKNTLAKTSPVDTEALETLQKKLKNIELAIAETKPSELTPEIADLPPIEIREKYLDLLTVKELGERLKEMLKANKDLSQITEVETVLKRKVRRLKELDAQTHSKNVLKETKINNLKLDVILLKELSRNLVQIRSNPSAVKNQTKTISAYEKKINTSRSYIEKSMEKFSRHIPLDFCTIERLDELLQDGILNPFISDIPESIRKRCFPDLLSLRELNHLLNQMLSQPEYETQIGIKKRL